MNQTAVAQDAPLLELSGVGLTFPGQASPTLANIDLTIKSREFLAIVGPSGCGKSTLLRIMAGLLDATAGTRTLVQQPAVPTLQTVPPATSPAELNTPGNIAMVFQEPRLLAWRNVFQNMQLPFELTRQPVDRDRIGELLLKTGLSRADFKKYPRMLSGGMKMRVAVARALLLNPTLVLLDEPFAAVDDLLREQLNDELLRLQELFGFTAVLVTHHLSEAVYLSDRLLVMSTQPGRIIEQMNLSWPSPRQPELRSSSEFASLCTQLKQKLHSSS